MKFVKRIFRAELDKAIGESDLHTVPRQIKALRDDLMKPHAGFSAVVVSLSGADAKEKNKK